MAANFKIIIFCFFILSCFSFCSTVSKENKNMEAMSAGSESINGSSKFLASDYLGWIENENNGMRVEKKIGDFTFSALYKPALYLAIKELKENSINKKNVEQKIEEYKGLQYFTFRIAAENQQQELLKVGITSPEDYYSRIEYFSFNMQKDFKLIDGKDTLPCVLFHFERVYGLAPNATFVLGFPLTKEEQTDDKKIICPDKTIGFNDQVFGSGNIYMTIKSENLNRIPEIILN